MEGKSATCNVADTLGVPKWNLGTRGGSGDVEVGQLVVRRPEVDGYH